jgi:chromate transporter
VGRTLAAIGLLLPAFLMILAFAMSYDFLKEHVWTERFLMGMQAAAVALIITALKPLVGPFMKSKTFLLTGAVGGALFLHGYVPEPLLIVGGGLFWIFLRRKPRIPREVSALAAVPVAGGDFQVLWELFLVCLKAGAFVFGSGIAIIPLLEKDFVTRLGWVTHSEFMDALAIGQVTPGPVLLTTAFLGYKVAGLAGSLVATGSVFLAGFIHMMTWFPAAVQKLSKKTWIGDFLFGALAMVFGTIVVTVIVLVSDWRTQPGMFLILASALILMYRGKIPPWALVILGGCAGLLLPIS